MRTSSSLGSFLEFNIEMSTVDPDPSNHYIITILTVISHIQISARLLNSVGISENSKNSVPTEYSVKFGVLFIILYPYSVQ